MRSTCPAQDAVTLLELYGERYIMCDGEQAKLDAEYNRDAMAEAYVAIVDAIKNGCTAVCIGTCGVCGCRRSPCKKKGMRRRQ